MLFVIVVIFVTLWGPYRIMLVYNSFATISGGSPFMDLWYLMFAKTCIYMNWWVRQQSRLLRGVYRLSG